MPMQIGFILFINIPLIPSAYICTYIQILYYTHICISKDTEHSVHNPISARCLIQPNKSSMYITV